MLTVYKILSILLIPVALLFGLTALMGLLMAMANPAMLLGVFLCACVSIYIFCTSKWLFTAITPMKPAKPGLKDWIKVNAFAAGAFAIMIVFSSINILQHPELVEEVMNQLQQNAATKQPLNQTAMLQVVETTVYLMLSVAFLLIVHIFLSFFFLKKLNFLFHSTPKNN
jgi:hypothetical protein